MRELLCPKHGLGCPGRIFWAEHMGVLCCEDVYCAWGAHDREREAHQEVRVRLHAADNIPSRACLACAYPIAAGLCKSDICPECGRTYLQQCEELFVGRRVFVRMIRWAHHASLVALASMFLPPLAWIVPILTGGSGRLDPVFSEAVTDLAKTVIILGMICTSIAWKRALGVRTDRVAHSQGEALCGWYAAAPPVVSIMYAFLTPRVQSQIEVFSGVLVPFVLVSTFAHIVMLRRMITGCVRWLSSDVLSSFEQGQSRIWKSVIIGVFIVVSAASVEHGLRAVIGGMIMSWCLSSFLLTLSVEKQLREELSPGLHRPGSEGADER